MPKRAAQAEAQRLRRIQLHKFALANMREYGIEAIENRAVPDTRDGLKPVQRKVLWTMFKEGAFSTGGTHKAAKFTGLTMGRYHPHSADSIFGAMITMTNLSMPLLHGEGSWGAMNERAAADRYVETKLSPFAEKLFFDRSYLPVIDFQPNYDGSLQEPIYLPALLPQALLNQSQGIAVGITSGFPPFTLKSVLKVLDLAFKNELKVKHLAKMLKLNFPYGGKLLNPEGLKEFTQTGSGTIRIGSNLEVDNYKVTITDCGPHFKSTAAIEKLQDQPFVKQVADYSADGKLNIVITLLPMDHEKDLNSAIDKIQSIIADRLNLRVNMITRKNPTEVDFHSYTLISYINAWCEWRLELERKRQKYRIDQFDKELENLKLMLLAVANIDLIFELLKKADDPVEKFAKAKNLPLEDAKTIFQVPVIRLSRMSKKTLLENKSKIEKDRKEALTLYKHPVRVVEKQLAEFAKFG